MKLKIWKNAYEIRIKNRRISVVKTDDGLWFITFLVLHVGEVNIVQFDDVVSRGNKHICITYLKITDETMQGIISGYVQFNKVHSHFQGSTH